MTAECGKVELDDVNKKVVEESRIRVTRIEKVKQVGLKMKLSKSVQT